MKPMRLRNGEVKVSIQAGLVLAWCMSLIFTAMFFLAVLVHPDYGLGQMFVTVVWFILTTYAVLHIALLMDSYDVRNVRWFVATVLLSLYDWFLGSWAIMLFLDTV